jgi:3-methyladenine DNA glycosylase/8-oxoguanine DNA glycosylase
MANTLRAKIIRLAHTNPELRGDLLPLLKKAAEDDDNPYGLYEGHEQVTERIAEEIASTAVTVASAYKAIEKLIAQNAKYGTTDSDARDAIWGDWEDSMKKAIRGKT